MPRTWPRSTCSPFNAASIALSLALLSAPIAVAAEEAGSRKAASEDALDTPDAATRETMPEERRGAVLAERVLERLRADPAVDVGTLGVVVVDGEVTISGVVRSLGVKQRAMRIAEGQAGVRSVKDRLRVRVGVPHSDGQVRHYVERALRMDPVTSALSIRVSTTRGVVTLRGEVPTLAERELAAAIAADVFAVREVRNRLSVVGSDEPRDATEIAAEVRDALAWDARLRGSPVRVRVEESTVHLEGIVANAAARRHAIENAWVRGVRAVDAQGLVVDALGSFPAEERAETPRQRDEELRAAVLRSLESHPRLKGADVEVSIDAGGRVTLRGVVDSVKAKRTATQLVQGRLGVRDVRNRLFVDPSVTRIADEVEETEAEESPTLTFDDTGLAAELREALRRDAYLSGRRLDVDVVRGHAYLAGDVQSAFERARAEDVAARLRGITTIHNEIVVERVAPEGEGSGARDATDALEEAATYEWADS